MAWRHAGEVREAIAELRAAGVPCVALETVSGAPSVGAFEWPLPCALVVGNERFGLDPDVVQACDAAVRIPLAGRKNSLNVVSALAVALFAATGGERKKEEGGVGRASVREER